MENYNIHFNEFATSGDVQAALDAGTLVKPYVALIGEDEVDINGLDITPIPPDYENMPLTFEITGDGDVIWRTLGYGSVIRTIEYKLNDGEWTSITSSTAGVIIPVIAGDIIQFRGDNTFYGGSSSAFCGFLGLTATFKVYGNIMSLLYSTGFETATTFPGDEYAGPFGRLFMNCSGLTDASNLIMPATTLKQYCYENMFYGCTSLTTAPELPAPTLANNCYYSMFNGCTSLNYIKCLATDISASNCTSGWLSSVSATGTFVKNPNMSSWTTGDNGIPAGWTVVDAS